MWNLKPPRSDSRRFYHLYNPLTFLTFAIRIQRGACHVPIQYVPQAEIIPILPDTDNAGEGNCKTWYTSSHNTPLLFIYQVFKH